jgi:hypothetical protein
MATRNRARTHPPTIRAALTGKQCQPEAVLQHIGEGDDVIVGMFNSEPLRFLDALEANAERLSDVRIHQMFPYRERRYMHGVFPPASGTSPGFSLRPTAMPSTKTPAIWYPTTSVTYRP